jgi:threonylcarbamoyladenosine tRNA methylthiotransferase MtaB
MPGQLSDDVKKQRVHRLIALAQKMASSFRDTYVSNAVTVLWETQPEDGVWEGLTDTYVRVRAASSADLRNQLTAARVLETRDDHLWAEVIP